MTRIRCPHCDEVFEIESVDLEEEELTCTECGEGFELTDDNRAELELADDYDDVATLDFMSDGDLDGDLGTELERSY
jgi:hypothetical protein